MLLNAFQTSCVPCDLVPDHALAFKDESFVYVLTPASDLPKVVAQSSGGADALFWSSDGASLYSATSSGALRQMSMRSDYTVSSSITVEVQEIVSHRRIWAGDAIDTCRLLLTVSAFRSSRQVLFVDFEPNTGRITKFVELPQRCTSSAHSVVIDDVPMALFSCPDGVYLVNKQADVARRYCFGPYPHRLIAKHSHSDCICWTGELSGTLWHLNIESGEVRRLCKGDDGAADKLNRSLAFRIGERRLVSMDLETGTCADLVWANSKPNGGRTSPFQYAASPVWSPDGDWLIAVLVEHCNKDGLSGADVIPTAFLINPFQKCAKVISYGYQWAWRPKQDLPAS